ncbi:hypothetical protein BBIA_1244, partial [Bifidobacterium biavatii DSM 23969]
LGQRVKAQRVEHRAHRHECLAHLRLRRIGIGAVGQLREQRIAVAHRREDRRGRARHVEVVVHRRDEIGRQIIRAHGGNLVARRLLAQRDARTLDEVRHAVVRGLRLDQRLIGPFEHRTVLHRTERIAHHPRGVLGQHGRHRQARAQRLRHLLALGRHPRRVHPVRRRIVAGRARLRHLVLVMGETQVETAAVDVEHVLEITVAHRRAFDVPARATHAERRVPARVERIGVLRRLPQREVARIMLVGRHVGRIDRIVLVVARRVHARAHAVGHGRRLVCFRGALLLVRQLAVVRPARHVEVHVAGRIAVRVAHHVAVAVVDDLLDQVDHVDHVAGRARLVRRRQHAERVVRLRELALVVVRARPPLLARGRGLVEDLVVDVSHVAHERDVVAELEEPAADDVERDGRADVADVRRRLHGRAAHVDADLVGLDRRETRDGVRGRVVQLQIGRGLRHGGGRVAAGGGAGRGLDAGNVGIMRFLSFCHTAKAYSDWPTCAAFPRPVSARS